MRPFKFIRSAIGAWVGINRKTRNISFHRNRITAIPDVPYSFGLGVWHCQGNSVFINHRVKAQDPTGSSIGSPEQDV